MFLLIDLIAFVILFPLAMVGKDSWLGSVLNFPITAIGIFLFIPSVSIMLRRFHDIEWYGPWKIVPIIGTILMIPLLIIWLVFSIFYFLTGRVGLIIWVFVVGLLPITLFHIDETSPMFYLVLGIPAGIYVIFALILCCLKGQDGPNKYGPPSFNLYTK